MALVTRLLTQNPSDYQRDSTFFLPNYVQQVPREELDDDLRRTFKAIAKAKRIAVVCGAGISTGAGIPDFRSSAGLFESLKSKHPEAKLTSGKDLFDASLFKSETNTALFYSMVGELKKMSDAAEPTTFHKFLKDLDNKGKLFRVYTQNIDALEEKVGLTYGLPAAESFQKLVGLKRKRGEPDGGTWRPKTGGKFSSVSPLHRRTKSFLPTPDATSASSSDVEGCVKETDGTEEDNPYPTPMPSQENVPPSSQQSSISSPTKKSNRDPVTGSSLSIPRCIPLHGHLNSLTCTNCSHSILLKNPSDTLDTLLAGEGIICAQCAQIDSIRAAAGERSRGVGRMKPDIVLYGEQHQNAEEVGDVTRRDLLGIRPDLLIVAGTTLKVPGTKLLVRELAKVIRPPPKDGEEEDEGKRKVRSNVNIVLVNNEFPTPGRDFKDVFDTWIKGDVQAFVTKVEEAEKEMKMELEKKEERKKERQIKKEEKDRQLQLQAKMTVGKKQKVSPKTSIGRKGGSTSTKKSKNISNKKISDMLPILPLPSKTHVKVKHAVLEIQGPRFMSQTNSLSSFDMRPAKVPSEKKKPGWVYVAEEDAKKTRHAEHLEIEIKAREDGAYMAAGILPNDTLRRSSRMKARSLASSDSVGDAAIDFVVTKPGAYKKSTKEKEFDA